MNEEQRERAERRAEGLAERRRRKFASRIAAGCAICGLSLLCVMDLPRLRGIGVFEPAASILLATAVAAGARALDGAIEGAGRHKPEERPSGSFSLLRLWLGCFAAIWGAIVGSHILPELSAAATATAQTAMEVTAPAGASVHVKTGVRSAQVSVRLQADGTKTETVAVRVGR